MAARGSEAKQKIINDLLRNYEGSFLNGGKELRIPMKESNSETVEIKVTLTCAKDVLGSSKSESDTFDFSTENAVPTQESPEPSAQEQENLRRLMQVLNF